MKKYVLAFFEDGTSTMLKIIGHIRSGSQIGIDNYGRVFRFCEPVMSASDYDPKLDGPIKFDI